MNDNNKLEKPVDLIMIYGLILFVVYEIMNRFIVKVPDVFAYPWMIVSCVLMLIGAFRTGKKLGGFFKK